MPRSAAAAIAVSFGANLFFPSAMAAAPDYQQKTADFLTRCVVQEEQCGDLLNAELKDIAGQALIGRTKDICVPLPLSKDQTDQLLLWMLSNAQQMNGFAADDIGLGARTLWPCK